ncbi:MAG: SMI1/KNR4 family protein [Bacteroidota bacterium]
MVTETYLFIRFSGLVLLVVILFLILIINKSRRQAKQDLSDSEILYKPYPTEQSVQNHNIQQQISTTSEIETYPDVIIVKSISDVLEIAKERGKEIIYGPPASNKSIQVLESNLGFPLPVDYKDFLANYGNMAYRDFAIEGILEDDPFSDWRGSIWFSTKALRENIPTLPNNCFPIAVHEDGAWCLEISIKNDSPRYRVINCEYGYSGGGESVASNFTEYFVEWFLEQALDSKIEIKPANTDKEISQNNDII